MTENAVSFVEQYESDTEAEENRTKRRKTSVAMDWVKEQTYPDKVSAKNAINSEKTWGCKSSYTDASGNFIVIYRCNKVKFRGQQCAAGIRLIYTSESMEVEMYRSELSHTHHEISTMRQEQINNNVKKEIDKIFNNDPRIKPKRMLEILAKKGFQVPKITQLYNYLSVLRKKKFGRSNIFLGELEKMLMEKSNIPDIENEAFVVAREISYEEDNLYFRFFISSKGLLNNAKYVNHIHADATYKLIWQGYPVLVLGTTDKDRHFHCFGISVCSGESEEDFRFTFQSLKNCIEQIFSYNFNPHVLVADAAPSIRNAFKNVFDKNTLIVMCWFHMKKNIDKKLEKLIKDKKIKNEILNDIQQLQLSKTEDIFMKATELFIKKWNETESDFVQYFTREWIKNNRNWFEGICSDVPSTNNALESFNNVIKQEATLRERLPISRFLTLTFGYIEQWSENYSNGLKIFKTEPTVTLDIWTNAYNWAKTKKDIKSISSSSSTTIYTFPSRKIETLNEDIKVDCFETFDEFKINSFYSYNVTFPNDGNFLAAQCDCPAYFKKFICKHTVGIAVRLKKAFPPPEAKNVDIESKRKRGRPSKAKKALLMQ